MPDLNYELNPAESAADPMRNAVRFPLRLRVRVEADAAVYDAVTEDISATGVLFLMEDAPPVNTRLTWTLVLPAEVMGGIGDTVVHCVGRVVWQGLGVAGRQVGVVIDGYRIGERAA